MGFAPQCRRLARGLALSAAAAFVIAACSFPDVTFSNDGAALGTDGSSGGDGNAGTDALGQGGDSTVNDALSGSDGRNGTDAMAASDGADAKPHDSASGDSPMVVPDGQADARAPDTGTLADAPNCNCGADAMYPTNSCQLLLSSCGPPGFQSPVACGATGTFVTACTPTLVAGVPVACTVTSTTQKVQECR
jgi:hypothetical protein